MISIHISGTACDTTDDRYRAEAAAMAVFRRAGVNPRDALDAYVEQLDEGMSEDEMTGAARVWWAARDEAEFAARQGWHNPEGCIVTMDA